MSVLRERKIGDPQSGNIADLLFVVAAKGAGVNEAADDTHVQCTVTHAEL